MPENWKRTMWISKRRQSVSVVGSGNRGWGRSTVLRLAPPIAGVLVVLAALLAQTWQISAKTVAGAPSNLVAEAVGDGVELSWDAPAGVDVSGYRILRRYETDDTPLEVLVDNTGSAQTRFIDESVRPGTGYVYRVEPIGTDGAGPRSNYVRLKTPEEPVPPADLPVAQVTDATLSGITVDGTAVPNFNSAHPAPHYGVAAGTTQVTVAATASNESSTVAITSPADADSTTDGHQVDLSNDRTLVTITSTLDSDTLTYTLNIGRGDAARDFSLLQIVGGRVETTAINNLAASDGHFWVLVAGGLRIDAFSRSSTGVQPDSTRDFDRHADNSVGSGLWTDGTTIWVADWNEEKIYAYTLETGARDSAKDFDTLIAAGNTEPIGLWSDGTTM